MGSVMSRAAGRSASSSDIEMGVSYQRFDRPDPDLAWVSGRPPAGLVDCTTSLSALMGDNVGERQLMVRLGSTAHREMSTALGALPQDLAGAWRDVMVDGSRREGAEHFATLVRSGALDLNRPRNLSSSLLHQLAREGRGSSEFSLADRFTLLRDAGVDLELSVEGSTPHQAAVDAGNHETAAALRAAGANPDRAVSGGASRARFDANKVGQFAARVMTGSGVALLLSGVGTYVSRQVVSRTLRRELDLLADAQTRDAVSVAARDAALLQGVAQLTGDQVGPVRDLPLEAAGGELHACVVSQGLLDLLPGLIPVIRPIPEPRPTLHPDLDAPKPNRAGGETIKPNQQPGTPASGSGGRRGLDNVGKKASHAAGQVDGKNDAGHVKADDLADILDAIGQSASSFGPQNRTSAISQNESSNAGAQSEGYRPGGVQDSAPEHPVWEDHEASNQGPGGEIKPDLSGSPTSAPAQPGITGIGQTNYPCRDEFDRYRIALYQNSHREQGERAVQQFRGTYHAVRGEAGALATGLALPGGGLAVIGTLMGYWLKRRAQAQESQASSAGT